MQVSGREGFNDVAWGPEVPVVLRYEDISQDGRIKVDFLPHAMGAAGWRTLLANHPIRELSQGGLLPILNRICIHAKDEPVSVSAEVTARARMVLAHTRDKTGAIRHILMNMNAEIFAPRGRTFGPPPDRAGERVCVGEVFAQHVFTRPFAGPGARRVHKLEHAGLPEVPNLELPASNPADLLTSTPDNAQPIPVHRRRLGLRDTDSNQHINSLVYPRLYEEATLQSEHLPADLLVREIELAFRRPVFAGDTITVQGHTWALEGGYWAQGSVTLPDGSPSETATKPCCVARLRFSPTPG